MRTRRGKHHSKYTLDLLAPAVKESKTYAEVLRRLGVHYSGGLVAHIKNLIGRHSLDTVHFLGSRVNCGTTHKGGPRRVPYPEMLVLNRWGDGSKERTKQLRNAMLQSGIPHECERCKNPGQWMGEPMCLPIDHRNGINYDNRPGNVRFLCFNCHSQTKNFGVKNSGRYADMV